MNGIISKDSKKYAIAFDELDMDDEEAQLSGCRIKVGDSTSVNTNLEVIYDDFANFNQFADKVFLNVELENSNISFLDVAFFLPRLSSAPWVEKNIEKNLLLSGVVKGRLNNFSTKEINVSILDEIAFNGAIRVKDITDPDKTFINVRTESLNTSVRQLTRLIPGFNPPQNYYKLGDIEYGGSFTGFTLTVIVIEIGVLKPSVALTSN